jgi:hypothetical protein
MKSSKKIEQKVDRREYCVECRKYHDRPTWQPGRPCPRR